jgi:hypothetical protein
MDPLIDVAFELLETATRLEKDESNRVEAATKVSDVVWKDYHDFCKYDNDLSMIPSNKIVF